MRPSSLYRASFSRRNRPISSASPREPPASRPSYLYMVFTLSPYCSAASFTGFPCLIFSITSALISFDTPPRWYLLLSVSSIVPLLPLLGDYLSSIQGTDQVKRRQHLKQSVPGRLLKPAKAFLKRVNMNATIVAGQLLR